MFEVMLIEEVENRISFTPDVINKIPEAFNWRLIFIHIRMEEYAKLLTHSGIHVSSCLLLESVTLNE